MSSLLSHALQYAGLGYPVFPCVPGGKAPATAHGFLDATTDAGQIEAWWTARPDANIGMPTAKSQHIPGYSSHIAAYSPHMDGWDSSHRLEDMPQELLEQLRRIAQPAQASRRLQPEVTRSLIQELCSGRYLTAAQFGKLLDRKPGPLRDRFLAPMVAAGVLRLRYAGSPNRPDQAYTAA